MERYLTAEEVLQLPPFAHLKLKTLTEWRSQGKGPDFTKVGNRPLYRESALNRWLLAQERKLAVDESAGKVRQVALSVPARRPTLRGEYGSRRNKTKRERGEEMEAQRRMNQEQSNGQK